MSNNKIAPDTFDMLNTTMDEIAREIGEMNPDDPVRAERLQGCARFLSSLGRSKPNETN